MTHIVRPALGTVVPLGTLYDAKRDTFLQASLIPPGMRLSYLPYQAVSTVSLESEWLVDISFENHYQAKFKMMDINPDLGASFLTDMVKTHGSAVYLVEPKQSARTLQAVVLHRISFALESLNISHAGFLDDLRPEALHPEATHIVTVAEYGVQSLVSVHLEVDVADKTETETHFRCTMENFKKAVEGIQGGRIDSKMHRDDVRLTTDMSLDITAYSDVLEDEGIVMHSLEEAYQHLCLMPLHIAHVYEGKGIPLFYQLFPIGLIGNSKGLGGPLSGSAPTFSHEINARFIDLMDRLTSEQQKINDYYVLILRYPQFFASGHSEEASKDLQELRQTMTGLKQHYGQTLLEIRSGQTDLMALLKVLQDYSQRVELSSSLAAFAEQQASKINFFRSAIAKGGTYVGHNDKKLSSLGGKSAYVLSLSSIAMRDEESWQENSELFLGLLDDMERGTMYAVVDCDAIGQPATVSSIKHMVNGKLVTQDFLEHRKFMDDHCFARYEPKALETKYVQRPLKRRPVRMPCPKETCDQAQIQDWYCHSCQAPLEFGYTDNYMYCDCGRALYEDYSFRCTNPNHGPDFEPCRSRQILSTLKGLGQAENINILILGETGVGKSTFINAFINYLSFETLQDAMEAEELTYVIPSSFSTQVMDRSRPDGLIEQIEIKVGSRDDEKDGSRGASATQQTTVYPVTIRNRTIRLIDTPGIGDTRGLQYDRKNMADLLSTLSNYEDLHGILILLKSNNSRLTVTFNFCMKELLTHLHRQAARNIAFGFTNTRISNYTPGDTFGSLTTLLQDHADIGLSLTYDSE